MGQGKGKGNDACTGTMLLTPEDQAAIEAYEIASFSDSTAEEFNSELSADQKLVDSFESTRNEEVLRDYRLRHEADSSEKAAFLFAEETLNNVETMRKSGAGQEEVELAIEKARKEFNAQMMDRLQDQLMDQHGKKELPEFKSLPRKNFTDQNLQVVSGLTEFREAFASTEHIPEDIRFPVLFYTSPEFQGHYQDILVEDASKGLASGPLSEKRVEDAFRKAILRTLGINEKDKKNTTGLWVSTPPPEPAVEYYVELKREFAGNAKIDLIMVAHEVGSEHGYAFTQQFKSYKKPANKNDSLDEFKPRDRLLVSRVTSITPSAADLNKLGQKRVLKNALKIIQQRFLATSAFVDVTPTEYGREIDFEGATVTAKQSDWYTYRTSITRAAVHHAIYAADPDKIARKAYVLAKEGSEGKVVMPITMSAENGPVNILVQTPFQGRMERVGGRKRLKITSAGGGDLGVEVPGQGCFDISQVISPSVHYAETWIKNMKDAGEIIEGKDDPVERTVAKVKDLLAKGILKR